MTSIPSLTPGDTVAVTLEAAFRDDAEPLGMFYIEHSGGTYGIPRAAITSVAVIKPPKPPEPTGHLAVVEDTDGSRWVNWRDPRTTHVHKRPWVLASDSYTSREYADIHAVKVLSEGVGVAR